MRDVIALVEKSMHQSIEILEVEERELAARLGEIQKKRKGLESVLAHSVNKPPVKKAPTAAKPTGGTPQRRGRIANVAQSGPFKGMSVTQATEKLMADKPGITPRELLNELLEGAFPMPEKNPYKAAANAMVRVRGSATSRDGH